MESAIHFLLRHGYLVVFASVFLEQIGLPLPAVPVLVGMGALAGSGQLGFVRSMAAALAAAVLADFIWYRLGHWRGRSILNLLCRISLEPDSCVRRTEDLFLAHGARALLFAKFVPGLSTAAPPLAGMFGMPVARFLLCDAAGAALWAGAFSGAGYLFSHQIEQVAQVALRLGTWLLVLLGGGLAAFIGWKYAQRRRFLRSLRIARIQPEELLGMLDAEEKPFIVDLRHSLDYEAEAVKLPGALHLLPRELEERHHEIPRDRDIILYCT